MCSYSAATCSRASTHSFQRSRISRSVMCCSAGPSLKCVVQNLSSAYSMMASSPSRVILTPSSEATGGRLFRMGLSSGHVGDQPPAPRLLLDFRRHRPRIHDQAADLDHPGKRVLLEQLPATELRLHGSEVRRSQMSFAL